MPTGPSRPLRAPPGLLIARQCFRGSRWHGPCGPLRHGPNSITDFARTLSSVLRRLFEGNKIHRFRARPSLEPQAAAGATA